MLLDFPSYAVRIHFDPKRRVDTYEILDPQTGAPVGFASEVEPGVAGRWVRNAFGRNLFCTALRLYEHDAQTLVFSLEELPGLWCPRLMLLEASGNEVCSFLGAFATIGGGFFVRNGRGEEIGQVYNDLLRGDYILKSHCGQILGRIQEVSFASEETRNLEADYLVTTGDFKERGLATILLLGATFALDIVYRDRAGDEEPSSDSAPSH